MRPVVWKSLSAKALVLTIVFVMIAEVLIFTPSVARFRDVWIKDKLADGHLAALALAGAPEGVLDERVKGEILDRIGVLYVDLRLDGESHDIMVGDKAPVPGSEILDVDDQSVVFLIVQAFDTMINGADRTLWVRGTSPHDDDAVVTVILPEHMLQRELLAFAWRIFLLSLAISLITGALVFLALRWLILLPMVRFTSKLLAFQDNPDDAGAVIVPTKRSDELGIAERALHDMQNSIRAFLRQQTRLAAMGTAVAKINHDLRNILSTALIVSDRLTFSADPEVAKLTPRLVESLDRAVDLCSKTLHFTRDGDTPLYKTELPLRAVAQGAVEDLAAFAGEDGTLVNDVPAGLRLSVDPDQVRRALLNVGKNAFEAGATSVRFMAKQEAGRVFLCIRDNGPGLPPKAREHLFKPFAGNARPGGTGLGLVIAQEIIRAHRGEIGLVSSTAEGTEFQMVLPALDADGDGAATGEAGQTDAASAGGAADFAAMPTAAGADGLGSRVA